LQEKASTPFYPAPVTPKRSIKEPMIGIERPIRRERRGKESFLLHVANRPLFALNALFLSRWFLGQIEVGRVFDLRYIILVEIQRNDAFMRYRLIVGEGYVERFREDTVGMACF
jgi:hypothetical protein